MGGPIQKVLPCCEVGQRKEGHLDKSGRRRLHTNTDYIDCPTKLFSFLFFVIVFFFCSLFLNPSIQHPKIGRSRNWQKSKLAEVDLAELEKKKMAEVEIGRSRPRFLVLGAPVSDTSAGGDVDAGSSLPGVLGTVPRFIRTGRMFRQDHAKTHHHHTTTTSSTLHPSLPSTHPPTPTTTTARSSSPTGQ